MPLEPGTHLGPYQIASLLGAVAMGEVYQAKDDWLNRTVAVKMLPPDLVSNPQRRRRLVQPTTLPEGTIVHDERDMTDEDCPALHDALQGTQT